MSLDKLETAIHEAGHAILARLTNKANVYEMYVERMGPEPWDGHLGLNWLPDVEVTDEDVVGVLFGGPCAEMKYVANKDEHAIWDFDLDDDSTAAFLSPVEIGNGLISVQFRTAAGLSKIVEFDHGPFGTDQNMARQRNSDEVFLAAQYRRVREILNQPNNWNAVYRLGDRVAQQPVLTITRSQLWGPQCQAAIEQALNPPAEG